MTEKILRGILNRWDTYNIVCMKKSGESVGI